MRLIKMIGGLGNQMFIYAMYLKMKKQFKNVRIDLSDMVHYKVHYGYEMNRVFNLPNEEFCINQSLKKVLEFLLFRVILERKQNGRMEPYTKSYVWPLIYFKGFYQNERYFADIKDEIHRAFTFDPNKANDKSIAMIKQMDADDNSVSLHIRRGDYLLPKHWDSIGCICQLPYYKHALEETKKRVKDPTFYVFSDDLEWVKQNLPLDRAVFIDWNKDEDSWQDMMLMSHCRSHIICNSTFSWWGAWLDPHEDKLVIAPDQWTKNQPGSDIIPSNWIQVSTKE